MLRRLSDSRCLKSMDNPLVIVKCVKDLGSANTVIRMLGKAVSIYVSTGKIGPFLTTLGSIISYSESTALTAAINLLINQSTELPPEIFRIIIESLGPVTLVKHAMESGMRLPKHVVSAMVSGMGCYELSSLSLTFHERSPDKVVLLEFIKKALKSPWCPGVVKDAIKMLTQSLRYGVIGINEVKELLKNARVRIVIKRRKGALVGVKMIIGDRIIGDETEQFVVDFIKTAERSGLIKV